MSHWPTVSLGDVAEVSSGGGAPQDPNDFGHEGVPFVRAGSLKRLLAGDGAQDLEQLTPEIAAKHKLKLFPADSVLFAKSGMSASIGLVCRLRWPAYVVNHLAAVVSGDRLDCRFLHHHLRKFSPASLIQDAAYPSIRLSDIAALKIPLPPLPEQRRIAAILDQADALRAKRRDALAQLDSLTQSIFIEMFGDPAKNSLNLPIASLSELGSWHSGGTPPRGEERYFNGDIPWFSSGELEAMYVSKSMEHISEDAVRQTSAKLVPAGALMLGMYDTAALKASITTVNCSCNQAIAFAKIRPEIAETVYVYYAIIVGREHFRRLQRGVRQKNLNLSMIRDIQIPAPPIEHQRNFSKRVQALESVKAVHQTALTELDTLFASLQHRAFRGEL